MANKNKAFRPPPLPFSGNKKYWAGELYDEAALLPSGATVWDCFGGSGVCARCIKDARPDVRVVYNDFDGYSERLRRMPELEILRRELLRVAGGEDKVTRKRRRLTEAECREVQAAVRRHRDRYGYYDALCVRRWLSIGAPKGFYDVEKPPAELYARVSYSPIDVGAGLDWLDGLEVVRHPVQELPVLDGDFVILDPPYAATVCDEYSGRETFQVLKYARDLMMRCPFILFGDLSIQFWYDVLTERFNPRFQVKFDVSVSRFGGKSRSEIMYSNW